ncbi:MAG: ribosomal protein S18-alanine N-acetyltransferase [Candidatus Bipolaricaulaceae bacterium]
MNPVDLQVRRGKEADLGRVLEIERASFPHPWPEAHFLPYLRRGDCLVAGDRGEVVGFLIATTDSEGRGAHLMNLAVLPRARRQGVASRLLTTLASNCRQSGLGTLRLEVRAGNRAAIALYTRHGFTTVRRIPNFYGSGQDAVLMEKTLGGAAWGELH